MFPLAALQLQAYRKRGLFLRPLTLDNFVDGQDTIHIRFGPEPLQLPEPLEIHAREAIEARVVA